MMKTHILIKCFIQLLEKLIGMFQQLFLFNKTAMEIIKTLILLTLFLKKNVIVALNIHLITQWPFTILLLKEQTKAQPQFGKLVL